MNKILIVGYGVIGKYEAGRLSSLHPDIYDKYHKESNTIQPIHYDLAIIAVPTETVDGYCYTQEVDEAIQNTDAEVIIIKSTVAVGTSRDLSKKYHKRIVFSPEFSGITQHAKDFPQNFTILGGEREDCHYVQQILQEVFNGTHIFRITTWETAELTKYMINCYLATKVSFCTAFWEIADQYGVDYDEMRECALLDTRVDKSHTFVYDQHPFWDSHCLNKDCTAIANATNNIFLHNLIEYNNYMKKKHIPK